MRRGRYHGVGAVARIFEYQFLFDYVDSRTGRRISYAAIALPAFAEATAGKPAKRSLRRDVPMATTSSYRFRRIVPALITALVVTVALTSVAGTQGGAQPPATAAPGGQAWTRCAAAGRSRGRSRPGGSGERRW